MSEGTCPTVTIDTPQGPTDINQSDFDPAKHTLHSAKRAAEPKADAEPKGKTADKTKPG